MAITATVTAASGNVANTATVDVPPGTTDPDPTNNSATDTDPVIPPTVLGFSITKTNNVTTLSPNGTTTYVVTLTNTGNAASTATLYDPAVAGLTKTAVACGATPGACATPPTVSNIETSPGFVTPSIPVGGTYQIAITATVTATSGSVTNTAIVTPPGGTPVPASDTDPVAPVADLGVTKTDNITTVTPGGSTTYVVTVTNNGPSPSTATLKDVAATGLTKTAVACGSMPGNVQLRRHPQ